MILDHIGIAVRSLEQAAQRWEAAFGYRRLTRPVVNTRQQVKVLFLAKEGSLPVKLIEPDGLTSPIAEFTRRGGGLHHLCFRCPSIDAETARLTAMGLRLLAAPQPGEAFENERIAFVYAGDGLNIEIIDTFRRAELVLPDDPRGDGSG